MELVYLWVEDYKNIQKQGFNFSPNYSVEFTPVYKNGKLSEKSELKIIPKENPLKFFFGDNISISTIVGENGSGKSTIHEIIVHTIFEVFDKFDKKNEEMFYDKCVYKYENIILFFKEESIIYSLVAGKTQDVHLRMPLKNLILNTKLPLIHNKSNFSLNKLKSFFFNNTYFLDFTTNYISYIMHYYIAGKNGYTTKYDNKILENSVLIGNNLRLSILVKILFLLKINKEYFSFLDSIVKFDYIYINLDVKEQEKIRKEYNNLINEIDYKSEQIKKEFYISEKEKIIRFLKETALMINLDSLKEEEFYFLMLLSKHFENIDEYNLLTIEFLSSSNNLSLNHLSSGEQIFIKFFIELFYTLEVSKVNKEDVILMLDEIELTLHPNLQKKLMYYLIEGLKRLKFVYKLHIIINTHSPFILSDLPKENIIFLEKGKQVYPFDDGKQTFGANIHTLLSHGFFMKDGLMGEFAKDKIDDVINYLNNKKSEIKNDDDAQNIINIIGEPVIKRELQRMLKNKMELSNKTEIDKIREKVDRLTQELAQSTKRLEELEKKDDK